LNKHKIVTSRFSNFDLTVSDTARLLLLLLLVGLLLTPQ
jgi:hypothetical protein